MSGFMMRPNSCLPSWSGIIARMERRQMARTVSKSGTPMMSSGTPMEARKADLPPVRSGTVARTRPMNIEPQSPRKMVAGLKL